MTVKSIYPDICASDIAASRDFYVGLLDLTIDWEAEWYVALGVADNPAVQLALVAAGHDSVPAGHQQPPAGVLISFEVDDATPSGSAPNEWIYRSRSSSVSRVASATSWPSTQTAYSSTSCKPCSFLTSKGLCAARVPPCVNDNQAWLARTP